MMDEVGKKEHDRRNDDNGGDDCVRREKRDSEEEGDSWVAVMHAVPLGDFGDWAGVRWGSHLESETKDNGCELKEKSCNDP